MTASSSVWYTYSGESLVVMDADVSTSLDQLLNTLLMATELVDNVSDGGDVVTMMMPHIV
jgi:hypothetical protein